MAEPWVLCQEKNVVVHKRPVCLQNLHSEFAKNEVRKERSSPSAPREFSQLMCHYTNVQYTGFTISLSSQSSSLIHIIIFNVQFLMTYPYIQHLVTHDISLSSTSSSLWLILTFSIYLLMIYPCFLRPVTYDLSLPSASSYLWYILVFYVQFLMTYPYFQHLVTYDISLYFTSIYLWRILTFSI
jgi:hypothetical protein